MPNAIVFLIIACIVLVIVGAALYPTKQLPGFIVVCLGVLLYMIIDLVRATTGHG